MWIFQEREGFSGLEPCDQGGFIYAQDAWEKLKAEVDLYFQTTPEEHIKHHNELAYSHHFPDAEERQRRAELYSLRPADKSGYVYIAKSGEGQYKIGISRTPKKRVAGLKTQTPSQVTLIHIIPADDMRLAEKQLHLIFTNQRVNGEWFNLSQKDVDWLCCIEGYNDGTFHANS